MAVELLKTTCYCGFRRKNRPKTGFQETEFLFSDFGLCPKAVSAWMFIAIVFKFRDKIFRAKSSKSSLKMENQKTELKKFNKVKLLQMIGLLRKEFNYDTQSFENSRKLNIICFVNIFLRVTYPLKNAISYFFPREATIQLFLGLELFW